MLQRGYQERTSPRVTARGLVVVIGVMLGVVLLGNWAARRVLDDHGQNLGYAVVDHKWTLLERLSEPVDWLIVGDSSVSQGLSPAVVEAQAGHRALNLGTIGAFGLSDDLWMLREYIERFGAPKRVVVIHAYDVWSRELRRDLMGRIPRRWVLSPQTAERYAIDLSVRRDIILNRHVPLYAERASLRRSLKVMGRRPEGGAAGSGPLDEPTLLDDGFVRVCGASPSLLETDFESHLRVVRSQPPRISSDNRRALQAIAALSSEHGFAVHILPGPIYEDLLRDEAWARYFADLSAQLRALVEPYPRVTLGSRPMGIPAAQLQSVDHVSCDAVESYTRWVIEQIEPGSADR